MRVSLVSFLFSELESELQEVKKDTITIALNSHLIFMRMQFFESFLRWGESNINFNQSQICFCHLLIRNIPTSK